MTEILCTRQISPSDIFTRSEWVRYLDKKTRAEDGDVYTGGIHMTDIFVS